MIGCPACAGVVRADVGPHHVDFTCSVGHAFSLRELYIAKEDQLEQAQWSLVALLKHLQMLLRLGLESGEQQALGFPPQDLQQRLEQVTHHIKLVERIIHETRLPSTREAMDRDECAFQRGYE